MLTWQQTGLLASLLVALCCFAAVISSAEGEAPKATPKWEYKKVWRPFEDELNKLGAEGWEMVCPGETNSVWMKRAK
jgi:hypothetical protein